MTTSFIPSALFKRAPITWKVTLFTLLVGTVVWLTLDQFQTRQLESLFRQFSLTLLDQQGQEDRMRFHESVGSTALVVELLANLQDLQRYLASPAFDTAPAKVREHTTPPPWLHETSLLRVYPSLGYVQIIDQQGRLVESFRNRQEPLPSSLQPPSTIMQQLSNHQTYVTSVENRYYVLSSRTIKVANGRSFTILGIAALDSALLTRLHRAYHLHSLVALLSGEPRMVIASSSPEQLSPGTPYEHLQRDYLMTSKVFFDYGSADQPLEYASLISKAQFNELSGAVLTGERQMRSYSYLILLLIMVGVAYWIGRNIQKLSRELVNLAKTKLGIEPRSMALHGDQLFVMEEQFRHMVDEILHAREALKLEAEERIQTATAAIRSALDEVEEQLKVTAKLYENTVEGMMVMNERGVVKLVNPAFTAITGYRAEDIIGQVAPLLRNDHHDDDVVEAMWHKVRTQGQWREEIWNRRQTGEAYPEMMTITAIANREGKIANYVAVFHDLTELRRSEAELQFKTNHDALTGLPNRHLFLDRLQQILSHSQRSQERVAVLIFDLDRFKTLNDSLGHAAGDVVLQQTAERMKLVLRAEDSQCRLGGDEFAFIIREIQMIQDAVHVVRKLMSVLKQPVALQSQHFFLTASIGISVYPDDGPDASTLVKNADMAMNLAKQAGGNRYQFYTAVMGEQAAKRMTLENDLRLALDRKEFILYYQPKVDLVTGVVNGMEALVRWQRQDGAMVPPMDFIPLAEETGFIVAIGRWVLEQACRENQTWIEAGFGPLTVAVNLSARQLQQKRLVADVKEILHTTGLDPKLLELEVTETVVMKDLPTALASLQELWDMGIHISVDDFGTGYSSLSYLKRLPLNAVKIDRSFVRDITTDSDDSAIVEAIISMAHSLNLQAVAEGVETQAQLGFLRRVGCDLMQGFLFSPPVSRDAFTRILQERRIVDFSTLHN